MTNLYHYFSYNQFSHDIYNENSIMNLVDVLIKTFWHMFKGLTLTNAQLAVL